MFAPGGSFMERRVLDATSLGATGQKEDIEKKFVPLKLIIVEY